MGLREDISTDEQSPTRSAKQVLEEAINKADQMLSGIQHYASCKTARDEAAEVRKILRTALRDADAV